jgi:hypothetical protein
MRSIANWLYFRYRMESDYRPILRRYANINYNDLATRLYFNLRMESNDRTVMLNNFGSASGMYL